MSTHLLSPWQYNPMPGTSGVAKLFPIWELLLPNVTLFFFAWVWFFLLEIRGIKPGTAGWEAWTLPLCYAIPLNVVLANHFSSNKGSRLIRAIKDGLISRETLDMKVNYAEEKQKALVNKLGMLIQHLGDSLNAGASARVKTASLFSSLSTTTVYRIGAPT